MRLEKNGSGNGKDHTPLRNGHDPNFIPPHTELEQYLLAALLTDNRRLEDVGALEPEHFGYEAHRRIYATIRHLAAEELPATPETMTYMVASDPALVASTSYLKELAGSVVSYTPHAVAHYANELIALAAQRSLLALGNDLSRIFLDTKQPTFVERVEAVFDEIEVLRGKWRHDRTPKNQRAWLDLLRLENDPQITHRWFVPGWLPMGETCGLGGAGGEGKTLLAHQLATAAALGFGEWLGMRVTPMKAALVLCEDNINDAHWRQAKINRQYRCSMEDLAGELFILPRREADSNYLATFDNDNNMHLTEFFHELLEDLKAFGAKLVVLDTLFDVFHGDQNNPIHARKFIRSCCDRIARELDGIVILIFHPSIRGMKDGDYQSGTVQWNAGFRARIGMTKPTSEDKDDTDTEDTRVLSLFKTNLAPPSEAIKINWENGCFVRKPEAVSDMPAYMAGAIRDKSQRVFMESIEQFAKQGRPVTEKSAPKLFAAAGDGRITEKQLTKAMYELFQNGKIEVKTLPFTRTPRIVKVVADFNPC